MDLNQVAVVVEVVERGSFTAAAAALGVPKSSVSRSVSRLEQEMGVTILRRTTRRLALTDAGREWFERVRAALSELRDASAELSRDRQELRGVVRLTAPPDTAAIIVDAVAPFSALHPKVHVDVVVTGRHVDLVQEGIDLAVRAGPLRDSALVSRKLFTTDFVLYASPAHLKRWGHPARPEDLAERPCVLFRPSRGRVKWKLEAAGRRATVEVAGPFGTDDFTFVLEAVVQGQGIGLLPRIRCEDMTASGRLERVLPEWRVDGGPVQLVYPASRMLPRRVEALRDALVERLGRRDAAVRDLA